MTITLPRHHADPRRGTRARLGANDDFDILIQRVEQRHQPLHRKTLDLVVAQRRDLGLVEAEPRRGCGLRKLLLIQDRIERVSKPELGLPLVGVREAQVREHIAAAADDIGSLCLASARSYHETDENIPIQGYLPTEEALELTIRGKSAGGGLTGV